MAGVNLAAASLLANAASGKGVNLSGAYLMGNPVTTGVRISEARLMLPPKSAGVNLAAASLVTFTSSKGVNIADASLLLNGIAGVTAYTDGPGARGLVGFRRFVMLSGQLQEVT